MLNGSSSISPEVYSSFTMIPPNQSQNDVLPLTAEMRSEIMFKTTLIPSFIYTFVLFVIGVPGNFFVCYIYYFKWTKKTSRIFIIALAVFDLINNMISLPIEMVLLLNFWTFDQPVICKLSRFVTFVMNGASSTVLVGIAVDRLKGICFYFRMRPMRIQTAKFIVIFAIFFALATAWPALVLYGTQTIPHVGKTCLIDDFFQHPDYKIYPKMFGYYILGSNLVYDITFIILYLIIGRQIYRNRNFSGRMREGSDRRPIRRPSAMSTSSSVPDDEVFIFLPSKKLSHSDPTLNKVHLKPTRYIFRSPSDRRTGNNSLNYNQRKGISGKPVRSVSFNDRPNIIRSISMASEGCVHGRRFRVGKTTIMLFLVTVVFIFSFVPYCIIAVLRLIYPMLYVNSTTVGKNFYHLFLRTYLLASALNPLIYNGLNAHFRVECKKLIKSMFCVLCKCQLSRFNHKK